MCCFCLHFSDFNVLFKKNLLQFTFEKITCYAKREKKITCHEEKSQPPLPDIKWSAPKAHAIFYTSQNSNNNNNLSLIESIEQNYHYWKTKYFVHVVNIVVFEFCELNTVSVAINFSKH